MSNRHKILDIRLSIQLLDDGQAKLKSSCSQEKKMIQDLEAIFDGTVLQPEVPLALKAGTRVRIIVESVLPEVEKQPKTFLQTAKSLHL